MENMNIYIEGWLHPKNLNGIRLMNSETFKIHFLYNTFIDYDCIISTDSFKDYKNFNKCIIYGPHMSHPDIINKFFEKNKKTYFNCLSEWNKNLADLIINKKNIEFISLPFAVDIERFTPKQKTGKPIIYFKNVDKKRLDDVFSVLKKDDFLLFDYEKRYHESHFLDAISSAPYAIWIGRHESQGFAFQETLSCNTPIFVIDVRSMREEINSEWVNYRPELELKATAASYFNDSCGMISYPEFWKEDLEKFLTKNNYNPRNFIIDNLSPLACRQKWINFIKSINLIN